MSEFVFENSTILIVDDKPENLDVFNRLPGFIQPEAVGCKKRHGSSKTDRGGWSRTSSCWDVMMPEMNGFEVCELLKKQVETKEIPIIFMTALSDTVDKVKGFEMGAVDYVTKPFQHEEVLARIKAHITIRHLQKDLEMKNKKLEQALSREKKVMEEMRVEFEFDPAT